jgi:hypothetical protein
VKSLIESCGKGISAADCVQASEEMMAVGLKFRNINSLKITFLNLCIAGPGHQVGAGKSLDLIQHL